MSTQITIGKGQGITQAIASKLNLSSNDLKKIDTGIWSQVLTEIKNDNNSKTKFQNADTNYDSSSNNFKGWNVSTNEKISIDNTTLSKIKDLINNKLNGTTKPTASTTATPPEQLPEGAADNVAAGRQVHTPQTLTINGEQVKITRENGKCYLQNADGSKGEELIQDAKTGEYKTRTQYIQDRTKVADGFMGTLATEGSAKLEDADDLANAMFVKYNKDDQGNISRDDFFNTELGDIEQSGQTLTDAQKQNIRGMSDLQFDLIDKDGDGEITEAEYKAYLQGADINKDGSITAQEMEAYVDIAQRQNDVRDQKANLQAGQQGQPTVSTSQSTTPWTQTPIGKIVMNLNQQLQQNNNPATTTPQDPLDAARNARGYSTTSTPTPQAKPKAAPPTSAPTQNTVQTNEQEVEYSDLSSMRNGQNVTINGETFSARYGSNGLVFDGPNGASYSLDEMQQFYE